MYVFCSVLFLAGIYIVNPVLIYMEFNDNELDLWK